MDMRALLSTASVACVCALGWLAISADVQPANLVVGAVTAVAAAFGWWRLRRNLPATSFRAGWALFVPRIAWAACRDAVKVLALAVLPGRFRRGAWIDVSIPSGEGPEHTARRAALELALSFGPGSAAASSGESSITVHVIASQRSAERFEDLL